MRVMNTVMGAIILTTLFLVIFLLFIERYEFATRNITDKEICKRSVQVNANLRFDKFTTLQEIKCPTLFLNSTATKEDVVFKTLALAMADTWNEFLEGRREVFPTATDDYCVVRRVIRFENPGQYYGFFDYLLQHNPPNVAMPYFTYLQGSSVQDGSTALQQNPALRDADVIDTSVPYAAVFVLSKKENIGRLLGAKIGQVAGGTVGVISAGTFIYLTGGTGTLASASIVTASLGAGTYLGSGIGFIFGSSYPADWYAAMMLIPYTEESLNSLSCTKLPVGVTGKFEVQQNE